MLMITNPVYKLLTRTVTIAFAILYLLSTFVSSTSLRLLISITIVLMTLLGLLIMKRLNATICLVLLVIGSYFLWFYQADFVQWQSAMEKGASTMILLISAPILSMPFFYKPYQEELKKVCCRYITSPFWFLLLVLLLEFVLSFYMSVASIPLVCALFLEVAEEYRCRKTFIICLSVASALSKMCAPAAAAGVVPDATGITYSEMLLYGGVAGIILLVVSAAVFYGYARKEGAINVEKDESISVDFSNLFMLIFLFALLVALILVIDNFTSIPLMSGIALIAFPFAIFFAIIQHKREKFFIHLKNYYDRTMLSNPAILSLILICCFAGEGLKRAESIKNVLSVFSSHPQFYLLFPLLIITAGILVSCMGVHPHAMGAILSGVLNVEVMHTNPYGLALMILIPWSVALAATPFGATNGVCSSCSGYDPMDISIRFTWKWVVAMILVGTLICDIATIVF